MRSLLSLPFSLIVEVRNCFFDFGILPQKKLPRPVISVGNLTMGGTGKTPMVAYLARWCLEQSLKPVILTRGYGRSSTGTRKVVLSGTSADAQEFGDEPCLLAQELGEKCPIYVGSSRYQAGLKALDEVSADIFIVDDGFQHRWLHRDLNLLLIDGSGDIEKELRVFPAGRGREPAATALPRADLIVITKADAKQFDKAQKYLRDRLGVNCPVLKAEASLQQIPHLIGKKVLLVCAIANPKQFKMMARRDLKVEVVAEDFRADHYQFSERDWLNIENKRVSHGADITLITAKDAVKLAPGGRVEVAHMNWNVEASQTLTDTLMKAIDRA